VADTCVLIVDDDRRICRLIQRVAEDLGQQAQILDDAREFESVYESISPDIVFLDLCMPGADGVELLRVLADHGSRAIVIMMSGLGGRVVEAARTLGESLGLKMAPPLHKPLEFADVRERLAGHVDAAAGTLRQPLTRDDLVRALEKDELAVHFQPLIELGNDRLIAAEVLPRWRHPEHGMIQPHRFMTLAEETGLIGALTMNVLVKAIHESRLWRDALPRFVLSMNLSRTLLEDLELPDRLDSLLRKHGLPTYNLMFEVPESRQARDPTTTLDVLTRLRLRGIRLAIDAFGTGSSSLLELYRLPYSVLKIDPSLVGEVTHNEEASAIVSSAIDVGRRFGLKVVAEGLESQSLLDWFTEHDCDLAQGVRIAPPLDASRFLTWAEEWAHETDTEKATTTRVGDTLYIANQDALTAVNPAMVPEMPSVLTGTGTRPLPAPGPDIHSVATVVAPQPVGHHASPPHPVPAPPPAPVVYHKVQQPAVAPDHGSSHIAPMAAPQDPPSHGDAVHVHTTGWAAPVFAPEAAAQPTVSEPSSHSGYGGPPASPSFSRSTHSDVATGARAAYSPEPASETPSSRTDTSPPPASPPRAANLPAGQQTLEAGYRLHWYEIESVLGRGGFGVTYLAHDSNLGQNVAVKEFLPMSLAMRDSEGRVYAADGEARERLAWGLDRFQTEARTLAQFRHPNIVRVYSVFEANGTAYMVMEYERGDSLHAAIQQGMVAGEAHALALLMALMEGLTLMHQSGFIHRDIKAGNIFLRSDGTPVLLDFGSARQAMGVATRTLTSFVSPGYTPFEQYSASTASEKQGPWTDIYSLAATFYRVVTGRAPIDAVARATALFNRGNDVYVPLVSQEWPGYSHQFLAAIDAALAFQPASRPQDVSSWRAMLPGHAMVDPVTARSRSVHVGGTRPVSPRASQAEPAPVHTRVMSSF